MALENKIKAEKSKALEVNLKLLGKLITDGLNGDIGKTRAEVDPEGMINDVWDFVDFARKDISATGDGKLPRTIEQIREIASKIPAVEPTPPSVIEFTDFLKGGFRPGWIVIVGAFTGGGKTTWCIRETVHKAYLGNPTLYVSCELAAVEVQAKIDLAAQEDGMPIPTLPIWIEDRFSGLGDILRLIEDWKTSLPPDSKTPVVILDYLQRVRSGSQSNREREVAVVAEELQQLARRTGIILIAAAQLNRSSQIEGNAGPQLHHLRESGLIEQIADAAFLIHKTDEDRMTINLAKNRWGPGDRHVEYAVDFAMCRIKPLSHSEQLAPVIDKIVEYLQESKDHKMKQRDLSRKVHVNGRHPTTKDLMEAARISMQFSVIDGIVTLLKSENL